MGHRLLNILFVLLLVIAVAVAVLSFYVWNDPRSYELSAQGDDFEYRVEECLLQNGTHAKTVRGWIFIPGQPELKHQVFAELADGSYRKFKTIRERRTDVREHFGIVGQGYYYLGFSAGYREVSNGAYTGKMILKVTTQKGEEFSVEHQCKI